MNIVVKRSEPNLLLFTIKLYNYNISAYVYYSLYLIFSIECIPLKISSYAILEAAELFGFNKSISVANNCLSKSGTIYRCFINPFLYNLLSGLLDSLIKCSKNEVSI